MLHRGVCRSKFWGLAWSVVCHATARESWFVERYALSWGSAYNGGLDERLLQILLLLSIVTARASVAVFLLFCPSLLLLAGVVRLRLACALPQLFSACFHSCPAVPRPIAAQPLQLAHCSLRRRVCCNRASEFQRIVRARRPCPLVLDDRRPH
jgi:hypothetical protein